MTSIRPASRRQVLGLGALGSASLLLAACTTGSQESRESAGAAASDGGSAEGFPRTIEHVYGETTLEAQPERVATVSWVNHDVCVALGVVPVGIPETSYGGNANKSTDWFDAALEDLGGEKPTMYAETDGPNFTEIAALQPDVILAVYSGITQEQYDQLVKIAPTIAYPKDAVAYGTSWQDSTTIIGQALGLEDIAAGVIEDVDATLADFAAEHPELKDTTFLYGTIDPASDPQISLYTDVDNRPRLLEQLGMKQAPVVTENQTDDQAFFITWSPEQADQLEADVLVTWAESEDLAAALKADPLLSKIPAVAADALVLQTDAQQVLSVSAASALSLPWAVDNTLPAIAETAKKATGQ